MHHTLHVMLVGTTLVALATHGPAAGQLEPPSSPAPTMKPLDDVEPRIPIRGADLPLTITQSGSYYLAETIVTDTNGITINADHVTIDLMGYALVGGIGSGIRASAGTKNLLVHDGCVSDWGTHGVDLWEAIHSQVIRVRSEKNAGDGIRVQYGSLVSQSTVYDNGMTGIIAWHGSAIEASVARQNRWGLSANGSAVIDSVSTLNDLNGIDANDGSLVSGCTVAQNTFHGISVGTGSLIVGNHSRDNNANGIQVSGEDNRIEANHVVGNAVGIRCDGVGNLFIRNSAGGNSSANYDVTIGNDMGPIGTAASATSPWANIEF